MRRFIAYAAVFSAIFLVIGCAENGPTSSTNGIPGEGADLVVDDPGAIQGVAGLMHMGVPAWATTYEITIENLTPATGAGSSQPFSPPVIATHQRGERIFRVNRPASDELAGLAEDAMNGPLVALLQSSAKVADVVEGGGVIVPGATDQFTIMAGRGAQHLSLAFMLVNTNDAFGGADGIKLPSHGERTYYLRAYDAGSEENTELAAHIPGPCCGMPGQGIPTHEPVRYHGGIMGNGDLSAAVYGWDEPVAKLTIRRVPRTYEITVENLTPATVAGGSQVFSPPVLAAHSGRVRMFSVGRLASDALAKIAEDGDISDMLSILGSSPAVGDYTHGGGPIFPGGADTFTLTADRRRALLSLAFMLVNTNDAFSGADRLRLPAGGQMMYYLNAYDAGSEVNTELAAHIPGPCCGMPGEGTDESLPIAMHAGIQGVGDLSVADYGWSEPAAKLTVTRVK